MPFGEGLDAGKGELEWIVARDKPKYIYNCKYTSRTIIMLSVSDVTKFSKLWNSTMAKSQVLTQICMGLKD